MDTMLIIHNVHTFLYHEIIIYILHDLTYVYRGIGLHVCKQQRINDHI